MWSCIFLKEDNANGITKWDVLHSLTCLSRNFPMTLSMIREELFGEMVWFCRAPYNVCHMCNRNEMHDSDHNINMVNLKLLGTRLIKSVFKLVNVFSGTDWLYYGTWCSWRGKQVLVLEARWGSLTEFKNRIQKSPANPELQGRKIFFFQWEHAMVTMKFPRVSLVSSNARKVLL